MGLFSKLFSRDNEAVTQSPVPKAHNSSPSEKDIFQSPTKLAEWVSKYIVTASSVEEDLDMAPGEDARKNLKITFEQVERLAREEGLLRAVGASALVKQYYEDSFFLKYITSLYKLVAEHMYTNPTQEQKNDTRKAMEIYINSIADPNDEEMKEFQKLYLHRVYDDNENYYKLMIGGIGTIAINSSLGTFKLMRDAYCKVTQGMSYENTKTIIEAMEEIEKKMPNHVIKRTENASE